MPAAKIQSFTHGVALQPQANGQLIDLCVAVATPLLLVHVESSHAII